MRYTNIASMNPVQGHTHIYTSLGITDQKGRQIGYDYTIYLCEYVPHSNDRGYDVPPGTYYQVRMSVMRDNRYFGASNPEVNFATLDEAIAYTQRRIEDGRKRYAKSMTQ